MAAKASWFMEDHVILIELRDTVTLDEMRRLNDEMMKLLENITQPIHIIRDLTGVEKVPADHWSGMPDVMRFLKNPKVGYLVNVQNQTNRLLDIVMDFLCMVFQLHMVKVETMSEAVDYLLELDPALGEYFSAA